MRTITLDQARDDLVKVAEEAARAPVRIEDAGGHNVVVMSDELYGRLHRILVQQLKESMDRIGEEADLVTISSSVRAARDPDDDMVLETALAGHADCLVTGDKDLLALRPIGEHAQATSQQDALWRSLVILRPAKFLTLVQSGGP